MTNLKTVLVAATVLAECAVADFSHEMPKATNEKPLDTPYAELAKCTW
ncbi:MAG: hypothetical protein J6334_07555 [Kiritimatiellae bacterium]|nr:hypothetical protein [Kiritimatiellia bacterium]